MRLIESDESLTKICRDVEEHVKEIDVLNDLVLEVVKLESLNSFPEAERSQAVHDSCALYQCSSKTIFINYPSFKELSESIQSAVIAHEIGHAIARRDRLIENNSKYMYLGPYAEEFLADRLACMWGYYEGLREERVRSRYYGEKYVSALACYHDEEIYIAKMSKWRTRKLAGLE